ncbi:NIPSNAP family protein [Aquabacter sp. CN5-332]|uniref:NIPSNAP family protein n=1 Tax=Aquabacter sp. CN5-332 TaxID=3156608 RepID=UPI0032B35C50
MLYEIRIYQAAEGRADAMRQRFLKEVVPRLPKHGIELVGVFTAPEEDGKMTYITRFKDETSRAAGWAAFGADPDWKTVKTASEVNGPLLASQTVSVLSPAAAGLLLG